MFQKVLLSSALGVFGSLMFCATEAEARSDPWLGEIRAVAYNFCPRGWVPADGRHLAINQYQSLFSLFGSTYGGDGRTSFGIPDLRGRAATSRGKGLNLQKDWKQGEQFGKKAEILTGQQVPSHTHRTGVQTSADPANSKTPMGNALADTTNNSFQTGDTQKRFMHPDMISVEPIGQASPNAVNNYQPYLATQYCVATKGLYPSKP